MGLKCELIYEECMYNIRAGTHPTRFLNAHRGGAFMSV